MVKSVVFKSFLPMISGSIPGQDKLFFIFLWPNIFFYLTTILAYSQGYIFLFSKHLNILKNDKKEKPRRSPIQFSNPRIVFFCELGNV